MAVGLKEMITEAQAAVQSLSPSEVKERLDRGEVNLVVDVREPGEWEKGHVPDAVNMPRGLLELKADDASPVADPTLSGKRDAQIVVYCTKAPGARSLFAAQTLARMGFTNVYAMSAGLDGWQEAGLPVE